MNKRVSPKIIALTFGILVLGFVAAFYVIAWQEPTEAPPGGNVPAPINVSPTHQTKEGDLTIGIADIKGDGSISTNLNSDLLDDYHAADLMAGSQMRVWQSCPSGSAIRAINVDGSVECESTGAVPTKTTGCVTCTPADYAAGRDANLICIRAGYQGCVSMHRFGNCRDAEAYYGPWPCGGGCGEPYGYVQTVTCWKYVY